MHLVLLRSKNGPCVSRVRGATRVVPVPVFPRGRTYDTGECEYCKSISYYKRELRVASLATIDRHQLKPAKDWEWGRQWKAIAATWGGALPQFSPRLSAFQFFGWHPHWIPGNPNRHACCEEFYRSNQE